MTYGTFTINVGDKIIVKPGFISPPLCDNLIVTELGADYPHFFDGAQQSAISTSIIAAVIPAGLF